LFLLVRRVFHNHARLTGNFVHFFVERHALFQVLELHVTSNFRKDRESERVPCSQQLILSYACAVFDQDVRTVNDLVTRSFTTAIVNNRQRTVTIHGDAFAFAALDRLQVYILDCAVLSRFVLGRFFQTAVPPMWNVRIVNCVPGFANRLSGDDTDRFTDFNRTTSRQSCVRST
jgi:hypothetical protein